MGSKKIKEIADICSGYSFKSDQYCSKGKYKIITIKNVQDEYLDTNLCDNIENIPTGMKDYCVLKEGDVLISLTGYCGRTCIIYGKNLLLNQRVGKIICESQYKNYIYYTLLTPFMRNIINYLSNGAAQANLSPIELCSKYLFIPPKFILDKYNQFVDIIIDKNILLNNQKDLLTSYRDFLLPMLMNGQVSVKE